MTIKVGVIGTGSIGREHIHRISSKLTGAEIVAVSDVNADQARLVVAEEAINATIYDTGYDVISAPEVDAVLVTSWGSTHEEYVMASIASGKPVFCEKPLASTAQGCKRIVEAEVAHGKKLVQVGFMRRFDESYRLLKQAVDNKIGAPLLVHCAHRNVTSPSSDYSGDMPLTDSFVHEIDVLRWLLDDDYVSAQVVLPRSTRYATKNLQDPHMVLLESKKGIRIDVELFMNCQYGYDIQCQVVGESGVAQLPEPMSVLLRHEAKLSSEIFVDWKKRFNTAFDIELQEWITSTATGEMNGPSAWDGYFVAVTADACVKAKKTGSIIPIEMPDMPSFYR